MVLFRDETLFDLYNMLDAPRKQYTKAPTDFDLIDQIFAQLDSTSGTYDFT